MGYLLRLTRYVQDTKEELKKCTWPTVDELKGSTAVVMITILLLGLFIVSVDFLITVVVNVLTNINKTA
ncbi:MAG: preprotein translocase subunit SecE [Verrucomicrobiales bacterium]|nr:preprotein translocase subunit SecE [Verrucomicrobiales bacterium]